MPREDARPGVMPLAHAAVRGGAARMDHVDGRRARRSAPRGEERWRAGEDRDGAIARPGAQPVAVAIAVVPEAGGPEQQAAVVHKAVVMRAGKPGPVEPSAAVRA